MDISDTIKGKTVLSFEVINTICSRIPSVCISEFVPGKARPLGPAWCGACCLERKKRLGQGSGVHCPLHGTHSSWSIPLSMPPPYWVTAGWPFRQGVGGPQRAELRECLRSHCFFSLPNQRGAMNDQHSLRITPFPVNGVPPLPILASPSHWVSVREHLHRERQSSDWKEDRAKKHRKHVVLLGGLTQLQEGPLETALGQLPKCCSRCPLVHVCAVHPGRNPPHWQVRL